jgi:hypothetical protein
MGIIENPGSPGLIDSEEFSVTAPLPTLNTQLHYAVTEKWLLGLNLGWLAVEADLSDRSDFSGSIWNSSAGVRYKAFEHVGFQFLWNVFFVDIEYNKRDLESQLDYTYSGPIFSVQAYF